MSTQNTSKINQLLQLQPTGVVLLASWLSEKGYSLDLQKRYRKSNWLESIGSGAMKRSGEKLNITGALHALQFQKGMSIHIGAKSALALQGKAQYLELHSKTVILFGGKNEKLPAWFHEYQWEVGVNYFSTTFLPSNLGLTTINTGNFQLKISGAGRAMMECLYLVPENQNLVECYELMESLNNLQPVKVQELLEACNSVKVKRLFLYLAERAKHAWFEHLQIENIDLGSGKRSLSKKGVYNSKYKITIPTELENYDK
ncbi:MAG: type IV toxin-antitoxin system AbiEi family antitoxin [Bacteroidota bacterium]